MTTRRPSVTSRGAMGGLYAIVDVGACQERDPLSVAEAILRGGCARLQLRGKFTSDRALLELALRLAPRCRAHGVPFIVNDRPDIAQIAGADGVHLGQDDLPLPSVRRWAKGLEIGCSTHDEAQALEAARNGADVIGFGPVFDTSTKTNPEPTVGLGRLRAVVTASPIPVVAIGGIDLDRAREVRSTGAAYGAVISALLRADDVEASARAFHRALGGEAPRSGAGEDTSPLGKPGGQA